MKISKSTSKNLKRFLRLPWFQVATWGISIAVVLSVIGMFGSGGTSGNSSQANTSILILIVSAVAVVSSVLSIIVASPGRKVLAVFYILLSVPVIVWAGFAFAMTGYK